MSTLQKRIERFRAWRQMLSVVTFKRPNPFHDPGGFRRPDNEDVDFSSKTTKRGQLEAEMEAWEAASDEDFEKFEGSLG